MQCSLHDQKRKYAFNSLYIKVMNLYSKISVSVQQKEIHLLHCFENLKITYVHFLLILLLFILKCLQHEEFPSSFSIYVNIFLNKHYYFYFNEEAGQICDCSILWPGRINRSLCVFPTFAILSCCYCLCTVSLC